MGSACLLRGNKRSLLRVPGKWVLVWLVLWLDTRGLADLAKYCNRSTLVVTYSASTLAGWL